MFYRTLMIALAITSPLSFADQPSQPKNSATDTTSEDATTENATEIVDHINFTNDDTLHGTFLGFTSTGKIIWKNDAADGNIGFDTNKVRKIVIHDGLEKHPFSHTSYLSLVNQDTIPAEIISMNDTTVSIKTDYADKLEIPKNIIRSITFLPLGNKIHYRGPFNKEGWQSIDFKKTKDKASIWQLRNFALEGEGGLGIIMRSSEASTETRFTFKSTYLNSSSSFPSFIMAADLVNPKKVETEDGEPKKSVLSRMSIAELAGTSLIMRLSTYNPSLSFFGHNKDNELFELKLENELKRPLHRSLENGQIEFDVRFSKTKDLVLLYLENRIIGQWNISAHKAKLSGSHFGFGNLSSIKRKIAVTDIVVSSWNGITEPAESMRNEKRDTILLSNGTDRYSGDVLSVTDQILNLKAEYAELEIPTAKIQSLFIATKDQIEASPKAKDEVSVRFYGTGRITGKLSKGPDGYITIDSKLLGKINILNKYISLIEFQDMDYAYEIIK